MIDALAHRGPDATQTWNGLRTGAPVALAHARLSIIDLSAAANQPFEKDGLVLVFNGEIYNYRELARTLEAIGVRFRTSSDSEVLLEAWRKWGPESLDRLRGMFAFAIYDLESKSLVLARDHFGIKPLFYCDRSDGFYFASELKAIRQVVDDLTINADALVASVMYSWVPEDHCIYTEVRKVLPGTWVEIGESGTVSTHRFWDPVAAAAEAAASAPVDATRLGEVIYDSVRGHLVADVPVSTFLSGGLDSSLITVMAARENTAIDSYTISFREADRRFEAMPDDLSYARKVAGKLGTTLHEVEIAPDVANLLPKMVWHLDEPIGDAAAVNAYLICQAARERGVKVLLSGMGADELFAGYRRHYAALLGRHYRRIPSGLRGRIIEPLVRMMPAASRRRGFRLSRWARRFVDFAGLEEEAAFLRSYAHYDRSQLARLMSDGALESVDRVVGRHHEIYRAYQGDDLINRMCLADVQLFLPSLNLTYTDRATMAASTEVRVPFVDKEVFDAAFAIPGSQKIVGKERKAILKEASLPWIDREIAYRPKGLFSAPLRSWIRGDLRPMVDELAVNGVNVSSGLFDKSAVQAMVDQDRSGQADFSKEIWHLLTLELWMEQAKRQPVGAVASR